MSQFQIFKAAFNQAETVSHEGGNVYVVSSTTTFERFLILGTFGTFYANEKELTEETTRKARLFMQENPEAALDILTDVLQDRLAFRRDPSLFALAYLSLPTFPLSVRQRVAQLMEKHVVIGTDILHWAAFRKQLGGKWNKVTRNIVNNWFLRERDDLALQAVKYQQRDGWSLRDLARLAHPKMYYGNDQHVEKNMVLDWITHPIHRDKLDYTSIRLLDGYQKIRMEPTRAAEIIREYRLPREAVPSELLQQADVWDALLDDMPAQALVRNLGKLSSMNLVGGRSGEISTKILKAADRLHPMQFLVSWYQYGAGKGERGSNVWSVNKQVLEALEMAYAASFRSLPVIENVRPLIALDVSGSMTHSAIGLPMSCIAVEICMVEIFRKQFPNAVFAAYSNPSGKRGYIYHEPAPEALPLVNVHGKSRADLAKEVELYQRAFMGTDCAIPLRMAEQDRTIDAVVSITDSETGYGESPADVIRRIHAQPGRENFRHAVVGLAMNDISIADPNDVRQMDAVGASANLPQVLASFLEKSLVQGIDR